MHCTGIILKEFSFFPENRAWNHVHYFTWNAKVCFHGKTRRVSTQLSSANFFINMLNLSNLVCALILWRSGSRLIMGKFCQFLQSYLPTTPQYFRFRTITWVNLNGFTPNLICALILWRSGLGLLLDTFSSIFDRVISPWYDNGRALSFHAFIYCYFFQKIYLFISCETSARQTVQMKCQILFSFRSSSTTRLIINPCPAEPGYTLSLQTV